MTDLNLLNQIKNLVISNDFGSDEVRAVFHGATGFQKCDICHELQEFSAGKSVRIDWLDKLGVSCDEFNRYADIYHTYCLPRPSPFPHFDPKYLDTIDIDVLDAFRPYLERWYSDRCEYLSPTIVVREDSIIVLIFKAPDEIYNADLDCISVDDLKDIQYLTYPARYGDKSPDYSPWQS